MTTQFTYDDPAVMRPVAMGAPGQRTFFVIVGQTENWVRLWLEKQYLEALATALDEVLPAGRASRRAPDAGRPDDVPPGFPAAELEVDEIALGRDRERFTLVFNVHSVGAPNESAAVRCTFTSGRARQFSREAGDVCGAGRPICPLCGGPIDPSGHACPKNN